MNNRVSEKYTKETKIIEKTKEQTEEGMTGQDREDENTNWTGRGSISGWAKQTQIR